MAHDNLTIECVRTVAELDQLRQEWDALKTENPFMDWRWANTWWDQIGSIHELLVPVVRDRSGKAVLIAPWYLHRSRVRGKEIRFLGSGYVCSDYMSLLYRNEEGLDSAIELLGDWVTKNNEWDCLNLEGVPRRNYPIRAFLGQLQQHGYTIEEKPEESFWRITLPDSYDEFLANCDKKIRQKLRKVERDSEGRFSFDVCQDTSDLEQHLRSFAELHMWRSESVRGDSGCFEHHNFEGFLSGIAHSFYDLGQLWFGQLRIGDVLAATSFAIERDSVLYYYQTGSNSDLAALQPGWLQNVCIIRRAIDHGMTAVDLLRGDERYKSKLTARRIPHTRFLVAAKNTQSMLRFQLWSTLTSVKASLPLINGS